MRDLERVHSIIDQCQVCHHTSTGGAGGCGSLRPDPNPPQHGSHLGLGLGPRLGVVDARALTHGHLLWKQASTEDGCRKCQLLHVAINLILGLCSHPLFVLAYLVCTLLICWTEFAT